MTSGSYVVITPMRNEAATVRTTIEAMLRQTRRPLVWFILGDGSTDGSYEIVEEYTAQNDWIRLVRLEDRGFDLVGQGVAEVLNRGLEMIREIPSDYVVKLDADLNLPDDYFERLIDEMKNDPMLGIVSGHPYVMENDRKLLERHSDYFPAGPARVYRRVYLEAIGPFARSVGWDTVDILRMRVRGYSTRILHDLEFHHMRRMGTRRGYIDGMVRDGRNAYLTGYDPMFFVARAIYNARYAPWILRSICMLWGFFKASVTRLPRVVSREEMMWHRMFQRQRMFGSEG